MRGMTFLIALSLFALPVQAQPLPNVPVAVADGGVPSIASDGGVVDGVPDPTPAVVVKELISLRAAKANGDKTAVYLAVAALIALALKVLVDRLKKIPVSDLNDKAKHAIPWAIALLSFAAAVIWKYSMGATWTNAIVLGGGGPGAILVDNLWDAFIGLIKKPSAGKAS